MSKEIELYPVQYNFFTCTDNFTAFIAGIGSGKTFVGALKTLSRALPGTLGMVVAPTYKMLRDSTLRTFKDLAGDAEIDFNKTDMVSVMRGGGEILWRSADMPDGLRGPNLHWFWIDEGGLTHPDTWKIGIGRLRAGGGFGECWTTSTPKGKKNWLYEQSKTMKVFKATTLDNPFVSEKWKESLLREYSGQFLAQEIYADFVSFDGLIYNEFDVSLHVKRRSIDEMKEIVFGCDEGYTNPSVILKIGKDSDGRAHIFDEYYKTGRLQEEVIRQAVEMDDNGGHEFGVDSTAAGLIAGLKAAGIRARGTSARVLDGIAYIQNLIRIAGDGLPRLTVDPSCVNVINEFESYVWKEGRDEPAKEYDHAMDALRYGLYRKETSFVPKASVESYVRGSVKDDRPGW